MKPVRTRFAPSPTGLLHVGGIRTALFAWLVARHANGQFILRFEDTDKKREVEGARQHLIDCLITLGLNYDEGPDIGGPYGPYVQSERLDSYRAWAQKLIDAGRAYADPYTAEEVQAFREQAQKEKRPFLYRNHRPEQPPNWDGTMPLRLKSDPKAYNWHDEVMGDLHTGPEVIDDIILIKSDGYPTYNFAHIVDDAEMKISTVIRGQEFLASMPNYLNIYEALGIDRPAIATMPHIMAPDGKKKLSKRDGAKDVLDYIHDGFLPETVVSFIATMGWNDGTEQEIFSLDELIQKFSLDRVQRSGAKFDEQRLVWMNGHYIRQLSLDDLYTRVQDFWPASAATVSDEYKKNVLALVQERLKFFAELPELTNFFFEEPTITKEVFSSNKQLKKLSENERKTMILAVLDSLKDSNFSQTDLEDRLRKLVEQLNTKPGLLFGLVRAAITGSNIAPGLFETLHVLGKKTSLKRLEKAL